MAEIKNKDLFEKMPVPRAVMNMAIPTVVGQLIVLIYNMADTFFLGRTNNPDMVAAASLILPVFNVTISVASIAGIGGSALLSRLLGESRIDEAKRVFSFSAYFSAIVAAIFSTSVFFFMKPLLDLLGADEKTFSFASSYAMCVIVFGAVPTIMSNVFSSMLRATGESKKAAFGITMGGIINIALDPLFMFVLLPEGNEILGAGIATCISNIISCIYFIIMIGFRGRYEVLSYCVKKPENKSLSKIFAVGVPSAIATFLFDIDYIVIDRLMAAYGNNALAAIGIVLKIERLPLNVGIGICQGMIPIVAYNYSSGNHKRMKAVSRFSLLCGLVCVAVSITLYEIFAPQILRFFIGDAQTVALGTSFLRARALATVFMFLSFYHVHLFNSYGRGKEALFLGVMRWAVLNIPMLFILNHFFGMNGIVWSQLVADMINVAISVDIHRRFMKTTDIGG